MGLVRPDPVRVLSSRETLRRSRLAVEWECAGWTEAGTSDRSDSSARRRELSPVTTSSRDQQDAVSAEKPTPQCPDLRLRHLPRQKGRLQVWLRIASWRAPGSLDVLTGALVKESGGGERGWA